MKNCSPPLAIATLFHEKNSRSPPLTHWQFGTNGVHSTQKSKWAAPAQKPVHLHCVHIVCRSFHILDISCMLFHTDRQTNKHLTRSLFICTVNTHSRIACSFIGLCTFCAFYILLHTDRQTNTQLSAQTQNQRHSEHIFFCIWGLCTFYIHALKADPLFYRGNFGHMKHT